MSNYTKHLGEVLLKSGQESTRSLVLRFLFPVTMLFSGADRIEQVLVEHMPKTLNIYVS